MGTRERPRRGWAALGGAVMLVVAALGLAPAASGQTHDEMGDGMLPPGDWTDEQEAFLHDLIARTEAALPAYSDPATLTDLGFQNFGVTAPGGWDHWINQGWFDDGHLLDPEYPESLVFRHTPDGGYVLEAAMFFLTTGHDMSNIPADLAWLPGWHAHPELCVDENGLFTGLVNGDGTCSRGAPSEMPPMMHVWIVDNACDHRFGGVGVGGLDCDVSHDHEDPPDDPDDPEQPPHDHEDPPDDPEQPPHHHEDPPAIDPSGDPQPADPAPGPQGRPVTPRATPVRGQPDYTG
jgi:hypothetical protein